jgi:hypothetical protein
VGSFFEIRAGVKFHAGFRGFKFSFAAQFASARVKYSSITAPAVFPPANAGFFGDFSTGKWLSELLWIQAGVDQIENVGRINFSNNHGISDRF